MFVRACFTILGCLALMLGLAGVAAAQEPVPIAPGYVYDPSLGSLNDYCTLSEDQPRVDNRQLKQANVDFRGPCSYHDVCYAGNTAKSVCDNNFLADMNRQCEFTFRGDTTGFLDDCRGTAQAFHAAVVAFGGG